MMIKHSLLALALSLASTNAITITEDTIQRGTINVDIGGVIIAPGVYWSIINNALTTIAGSLTVGAGSGFYVSSTSDLVGLTVGLAGVLNEIQNDGIIAFNSLKSLTAPTYQLVGARFNNDGQMYLGGDGSVGVPIMSLTAADWTNNGFLSFYQNTRSGGVVTLGALLPITNNGQICLFNEAYVQSSPVRGSGCITVGEESTVWIQNSLLSFSEDQTIYLESPSSAIRVEALSLSQTFTVEGFGNGNLIGLSLPLNLDTILTKPYVYNAATGVLTLNSGLLTQNFHIGTGYNPNLFEVVNANYGGLITIVLNGGVIYNGPPPAAGAPAACQPCSTFPEAPGTSTTSSASSSSTAPPSSSAPTSI
ncbi:uncharacterized protein CANTADRAFT_32420, partial [Suhomyces tanzawaensis NRRL Y-17324]